jgi:hypothetical protein
MKALTRVARAVGGLLISGGVAASGVALSSGIAHANEGPSTWCPGQSMDRPSGPNSPETPVLSGTTYSWDMSVCHTWYKVTWGYGNVPMLVDGKPTLSGSSTWDGDNPPGPNPSGINCSPFWCPVPPHPDPNFHAG